MKVEYIKTRLTELVKAMETPLDELNAKILQAEQRANKDIERIKSFSEQYPDINISIDEKSTIAEYVKNEVGIYKHPEYVKELEAYTARFHAKFLLWYAVRDNFYDIYFFANAVTKKDVIVFNNSGKTYIPINKEDITIIKECQNGSIYIKRTPELDECIELAKKLVDLSR